MKQLKLSCLVVGCALLLTILPGCLLLIPAAVGGYATIKAVQNTTKGSTKITFDKPSIEDHNVLIALQSFAIWPSGETAQLISSSSLAEGLDNAHEFKITTPMRVTQLLASNSMPPMVEEMTGQERAETFSALAQKADVDAVIFTAPGAFTSDDALLKLTRASTTQGLTCFIYSRQKNVIIWQEVMNVKTSLGNGGFGSDAVQAECTQQLVKKILQATGKDTDADTNISTLSTNSLR
ncbi:MAG TPA: hypothetical protein VIK59_10830 [Verrucomicrobiae bacterium]